MERFPLSCPREVTFLLTRLEAAGHEAYAPETRLAEEGHVPRLSLVSPERIGSELRRTVSAPFAARAIRENTVLFRFVTPGCESELAVPFVCFI